MRKEDESLDNYIKEFHERLETMVGRAKEPTPEKARSETPEPDPRQTSSLHDADVARIETIRFLQDFEEVISQDEYKEYPFLAK